MLTGPLDDAAWAGCAVAELVVVDEELAGVLDDELDDVLDDELDWLAAVGAADGALAELHAWRIGAAMARIPSDVTNLLRETVTFSIY